MIKKKILICISIIVFICPIIASEVNPGYTLVNLRKPEWKWNSVTALAWLDDILVVAEFGGVTSSESLATSDGAIHLVSGALTANGPDGVTLETIATNLPQPMGLLVKNGEIYVHQKGSTASEIHVLKKIGGAWTMELFAKGWGKEDGYFWHSWPGGLVEKNGLFYFNFSSGLRDAYGKQFIGSTTTWPPKERGSWFSLDPVTKEWKILASGLRTNYTTFKGPWGELFTQDIQGEWMPDNKLIHLQEGHWYGHGYVSPAPQKENPPVAYVPQSHKVGYSIGQATYITKGPFKGQLVMGGPRSQNLLRYHIEKINDQLQGTIIRMGNAPQGTEFDGSLDPVSMLTGPDGETIFYGTANGWWVGGNTRGNLIKLVPNGKIAFEVLGIHSMGNNSFEIEFTQPVNTTAAIEPSNWEVNVFTRTPQSGYGRGANQDNHAISVTKVDVLPNSGDKKILIEFNNGALSTGDVELVNGELRGVGYSVQFLISLQSATGENLWDNEIFYTLNQFGPGGISPIPGCMLAGDVNFDAQANDSRRELCATPVNVPYVESFSPPNVRIRDGVLEIYSEGNKPYDVSLFNMAGKLLLRKNILGRISLENFPSGGLYTLIIRRSGVVVYTKKIPLVKLY